MNERKDGGREKERKRQENRDFALYTEKTVRRGDREACTGLGGKRREGRREEEEEEKKERRKPWYEIEKEEAQKNSEGD